jgi:catechol 2,3-dioxygenase-like lactoylglutathione lyase family enzyme
MLTTTSGFSGFSVDDLAAALAFYRDRLGLTVVETDMGLQLDVTGGAPVFVYAKPGHVAATFTVLNFEVDDIDVAVDELAAAGVSLERYPGTYQDDRGVARGKAANRGPDIAWFLDPAGNILSVLSN